MASRELSTYLSLGGEPPLWFLCSFLQVEVYSERSIGSSPATTQIQFYAYFQYFPP